MKVDYHIHTKHSDGFFSVEEVLDQAKLERIQSIAITDHDTLSGIPAAKSYITEDMEYVTGIEITCSEFPFAESKPSWSIHLLGYGFDETDKPFHEILQRRAQAIHNVYLRLLKDLQAFGVYVSLSEIPISCGCVLQLCDVANYLKQKYPMLDDSARQLVDSYALDLTRANLTFEEGIRAVHQAGGKAVWAHPFSVYHKFQKISISHEDVRLVLNVLKKAGLDGIEANYLWFSPEQQKWLWETAKENELYCTAGSDFHAPVGRNKMGMDIQAQPKEIHKLLASRNSPSNGL